MKKLLSLLLLFMSTSLFALEITKVESLNFGSITGKRKRIQPSKGARIFVKGIPGKTVEAKVDDNIILSSSGVKLKLENISFEKSKIVLDKVGKGVFRVGGVMSIIEKRGATDISEQIWIQLEYDN